jgi:hypothetical protein
MKNCKKYRFMLSRYFDNDLDADGITDLKKHLDTCLSCRKTEQKYFKLSDIMNVASSENPDKKFIFNDKMTVKSRFHFKRPLIIAVSCIILVMLAGTGTLYYLSNVTFVKNKPSVFEEPLGYIATSASESYGFIDNENVYKPMNAYFSYVDYEEH